MKIKTSFITGFIFVAIISSFFNLYKIDFGRPDFYHPDERFIFHVKNLYRGQDWQQFYYPPAFGYLIYFSTKILYPDKINGSSDKNLFLLFLNARRLSAVFGILTALLLFIMAYQLCGFTAGLLSGLLLSLSPIFCINAHYGTTDMPLTFFMLLSLFFYVLYNLQNYKKVWLILTGIAIGLATGFKYSGILILPPIIIYELLFNKKTILKHLKIITLLIALSALSFTIINPATFKYPDKVYKHVKFILYWLKPEIKKNTPQKEDYFQNLVLRPEDTHFLYHFKRSLLKGCSIPITILFILACFFWKNKKVKYIGVIYFMFYYLIIESVDKSCPTFERYALPVIPVVCLFAGCFISDLKGKYFKHLLISIIIIYQFLLSYRQIDSLKPDTRDTAKKWIEQHLSFQDMIYFFGLNYYYPYLDRKNFHFKNIFSPSDLPYIQKNSYFIESSFYSDRYSFPVSNELGISKEYSENKSEFTLIKEIRPESKSFLFNNPVIRIYQKS